MKPSRYLDIAMLGICIGLLSGCGNKGDLYPVPDELSDENLELIEKVLGLEDVPAAEAVEVDDSVVYDDENQTKKGKTRIDTRPAQQ